MERDIPREGLTSEEVAARIAEGKVNVNTDIKTKSVRQLVLENVLTLFNLINVVLAVLVISTGQFKNLTFLAIVLLNTLIGIVQSLRSKRMVDKLTLLAMKKACVLRDGRELEVELDQIVLDDILRLGRGDQIPADAVVVSGDAAINESLLTGESDLIRKEPGSKIWSGSFVDSGIIYARVVHVGADNYVAKINNEAKYVKRVNSEITRAINSIVRFASVIMVPLGAGLFMSTMAEGDVSTQEAILTTVGALLGMIPQGLVLLTSSVLALATIRLARRNVLAQQLYCIETLARVDVLCLDKTGTITSGRMEVAGVHPLDDKDAPVLEQALAGIAHATSADANETCRALLDYFAARAVPTPEATTVVPFSSAKKWSGAHFAEGAFVMGAAQFVLTDEAFSRVEDRVAELASTARVLLVAQVDGFTEDGEMVGEPRPLGFVTIRDEIRSSAEDTILYFCEQGVQLNVISGDDPRTVSSIARVVGIPAAEKYVDATTLDTPAKLDAAVDRYRVFGRVTPQQKRELVQALKRRGHTVAMTGDGVNDVLALKEADCSVAMAAGSDAARNVAEIVLVDNDFASMPAVVAEGRRSINNLQRSAALFLTKTLFSMALAALCIWVPPYPFQPIQMTLINFFCIGFPSFVLALEANKARVEGNFLLNVLKKSVPASVLVVLAVGACMLLASLFGYGTRELSTMSLVATAAVGVALIWRLSVPFTPLRVALFVAVVAGLAVGVLGFADFFLISPLTLGAYVMLFAVSAIAVLVFMRFSSVLDTFQSLPRLQRRLASMGGGGVRVHYGGGGKRLSSAPGAGERIVRGMAARSQARAEERELERARAHAGKAASGVSKRGFKVRKSSGGLHVSMPSKPRSSDRR